MQIFNSIFYIFSIIAFLYAFFTFPKTSRKQDFFIWIPIAIVFFDAVTASVVGLIDIVHIPISIVTVGVVNVLFATGLFYWSRIRLKKKQEYEYRMSSLSFLLVLAALVAFLFLYRYSADINIVFATSDPANHLKFAQNILNTKSISGDTSPLWVTPLSNALFIETLLPVFSGVDIYKSFMIKEAINLWLAGAVFYALSARFFKNKFTILCGFVISLVYVTGYPYNSFLYGFSYLSMSITFVCVLLFVLDIFIKKESALIPTLFALSALCLSVSNCYSLFAPSVYIGTVLAVFYRYFKEYQELKDKKLFFKNFVVTGFSVFLIPTAVSVLYVVKAGLYGEVLAHEGGSYGNLLYDFIIWMPFCVFSLYTAFKKKKLLGAMILAPVQLVYTLFMFFLMVRGTISTYYYYKMNYLIWMIVLYLSIAAVSYLSEKQKSLVIAFGVTWAGIFLFGLSGVETKLTNTNHFMNPRPMALSMCQIYDQNKTYSAMKAPINNDIIEMAKAVRKLKEEKDTEIAYVGYWSEVYWYEALTNQRQMPPMYPPSGEFIEHFWSEYKDKDYLAISYDSDEYRMLKDRIDMYEHVFETETGCIISLGNPV